MKIRLNYMSLLVLCLGIVFARTACASSVLSPEAAAEEGIPAVLDADGIEFDERTNVATATGHAVLRYQGVTMNADSLVMYSDTGLVQAFASEGKQVTLERASGERLAGSFLEYNLESSSGFMDKAFGSTKVERGTLYISGRRTEVKTADDAYRAKWLHGKYLRKSDPDDLINQWAGAAFTTCKLKDDPHYLFRSKKLVIVPGKYVIMHHPRVYAGKTYLFTSPFNVSFRQGKKKDGKITIRPNYEDKKYWGVVASTNYGWENGRVDLSLGYWHGAGMEYTIRVDQMVTSWMSVYAGDNYLYDSDLDEVKSRPFWGAKFAHDGWTMDVGWAQREKRSVVKRPGEKEYETTLWRDPEVELKSPWLGLHVGNLSQYARAKADWGRFQETGTYGKSAAGFIERYGWGIDYYTEYPILMGGLTVSPFFKGDYWNYGYKTDDSARQIITVGTLGVRLSSGIFELGTAYEQKRVSGHTGLAGGWDRESDSETLYQRMGMKIGPDLKFEVQGIISLDGRTRELTSMGYILTYDNSCCTRWRLTVNDDLTNSNNNDWISLSFEITAFPDSKFVINEKSLDNPFGRPGGLKMKPRPAKVKETLMEKEGSEQADKKEIRLPEILKEGAETRK